MCMMRLTSENVKNSPTNHLVFVLVPQDSSSDTATESLDRIIYANVCAPHIIFVGGFAGEMRPARLLRLRHRSRFIHIENLLNHCGVLRYNQSRSGRVTEYLYLPSGVSLANGGTRKKGTFPFCLLFT